MRLLTTLSLLICLTISPIGSGVARAGMPDALTAYEQGNYSQAASLAIPFAQRGDVDAQYLLGILYLEGKGVAQDRPTAIGLLYKAGLSGHPFAQYELGWVAEAENNERSYKIAATWYAKASQAQHAMAKVRLGYLYAEGLGVPKEPARAYDYYQQAEALGEPRSWYHLGRLFQKGAGVPYSRSRAEVYYQRAASAGVTEAQDALDKINGVQNTRDADAPVQNLTPLEEQPQRFAFVDIPQPRVKPEFAMQAAGVADQVPENVETNSILDQEEGGDTDRDLR